MNKFINFLDALKQHDPILIESIKSGYQTIFESVSSIVYHNSNLLEAIESGYNAINQINHIDNISGQNEFEVTSSINGIIIGVINFCTYNDKVAIKMIEISDDYKRKGIATDLIKLIQKEYPNTEIDFGMLTDEGSMWLEKLKKDNILYVDDTKKLKIQSLIELYEKINTINTNILSKSDYSNSDGEQLDIISDIARDAEKEAISLDRYDIARKFGNII